MAENSSSIDSVNPKDPLTRGGLYLLETEPRLSPTDQQQGRLAIQIFLIRQNVVMIFFRRSE